MSIFAEIESLEQRVQQLLAQAGEYSSVDDFVGAYTQSILDALGGLSQRELAGLDLQQLVEDALEASADFINVNLAAEIQSGVNNVLAETATFYTARGLDIPDLAEAISRTEAVQELTELFTTNMAEMREELLNGTIDTLQSELAQGFLHRGLGLFHREHAAQNGRRGARAHHFHEGAPAVFVVTKHRAHHRAFDGAIHHRF